MGARKMLMREWVGCKVRLRCDLRTKGGTEFKAGEILTVTGTVNGQLILDDLASKPGEDRNPTRRIRRLNIFDVELIERPAVPKPARTRTHRC